KEKKPPKPVVELSIPVVGETAAGEEDKGETAPSPAPPGEQLPAGNGLQTTIAAGNAADRPQAVDTNAPPAGQIDSRELQSKSLSRLDLLVAGKDRAREPSPLQNVWAESAEISSPETDYQKMQAQWQIPFSPQEAQQNLPGVAEQQSWQEEPTFGAIENAQEPASALAESTDEGAKDRQQMFMAQWQVALTPGGAETAAGPSQSTRQSQSETLPPGAISKPDAGGKPSDKQGKYRAPQVIALFNEPVSPEDGGETPVGETPGDNVPYVQDAGSGAYEDDEQSATLVIPTPQRSQPAPGGDSSIIPPFPFHQLLEDEQEETLVIDQAAHQSAQIAAFGAANVQSLAGGDDDQAETLVISTSAPAPSMDVILGISPQRAPAFPGPYDAPAPGQASEDAVGGFVFSPTPLAGRPKTAPPPPPEAMLPASEEEAPPIAPEAEPAPPPETPDFSATIPPASDISPTQVGEATFHKLVAKRQEKAEKEAVAEEPPSKPPITAKKLKSATPRGDLQLVLNAAQSEFDAANFDQAVTLFKQGYELLSSWGEGETQEAANCLLNLGATYVALEHYGRAVSEYSRLSILLEKNLGPGHWESIANLYRLAITCEKAGRASEARTLLERATTLAEKYLSGQDDLRKRIQKAYAEFVKTEERSLKGAMEAADTITPLQALSASDEVRRGAIHKFIQSLKTKGLLSWIICSALIFVAGLVALPGLLNALKPVSVEQSPVAMPQSLVGQTFTTGDGQGCFKLDSSDRLEVTVDGKTLRMRSVSLNNDWSDIPSMFQYALVKKTYWFDKTQKGIVGEEGTTYYLPDSYEIRTIEEMRKIGKYVQSYYERKHSYPRNKREWSRDPAVTYINPVKGRADRAVLEVFSKFAKLEEIFGGARNFDETTKYLLKGGLWLDEVALTPCAINCLSRHLDEKVRDEFVAGYFFMHAADRDGKLISARDPGTVCFLAFDHGENRGNISLEEPPSNAANASSESDAVAFITNGSQMIAGFFPIRYSVMIILGILSALSLTGWVVFDARSRIANPKQLPKLFELLSVSFVVLLVIWAIWQAIP
ncbi:MAG TPA: hypothetical protein V6D17_18900, partial [Candidatus Obscuribacterales bacterium]